MNASPPCHPPGPAPSVGRSAPYSVWAWAFALALTMLFGGCASAGELESGPTTRSAHAQALPYIEGPQGPARALAGPILSAVATPVVALLTLVDAGQAMRVDAMGVDASGQAILEGTLETGAEVKIQWRIDPSAPLEFAPGDAVTLRYLHDPAQTPFDRKPAHALVFRDGAGTLLAILSAGLLAIDDALPPGTEIALSPKPVYTDSRRYSSLCVASLEHRALRVRHDGGILYLPPGRWADLSFGGQHFRLVNHDGPVPMGPLCPESPTAAPHFTLTRAPLAP